MGPWYRVSTLNLSDLGLKPRETYLNPPTPIQLANPSPGSGNDTREALDELNEISKGVVVNASSGL